MARASEAARKFVKAVATCVECATVAGTAGGSYLQDNGKTSAVRLNGAAIEFVAAQLDVAVALVEASAKAGAKGKISPAALSVALAQKGLAFFEFAPSDALQCGAAIASLGLSLGTTVAAAPTGVGLIPAGAVLLSEFYATYVDCKSPVGNAGREATNVFAAFLARFEAEIYKLYGVPR